MAHSNHETIELKEIEFYDGRKKLHGLELYVDGCRRAAVEQRLGGQVKLRFDPVGAFDLQEARVWIEGLLQLSIAAEELKDGKKARK